MSSLKHIVKRGDVSCYSQSTVEADADLMASLPESEVLRAVQLRVAKCWHREEFKSEEASEEELETIRKLEDDCAAFKAAGSASFEFELKVHYTLPRRYPAAVGKHLDVAECSVHHVQCDLLDKKRNCCLKIVRVEIVSIAVLQLLSKRLRSVDPVEAGFEMMSDHRRTLAALSDTNEGQSAGSEAVLRWFERRIAQRIAEWNTRSPRCFVNIDCTDGNDKVPVVSVEIKGKLGQVLATMNM